MVNCALEGTEAMLMPSGLLPNIRRKHPVASVFLAKWFYKVVPDKGTPRRVSFGSLV